MVSRAGARIGVGLEGDLSLKGMVHCDFFPTLFSLSDSEVCQFWPSGVLTCHDPLELLGLFPFSGFQPEVPVWSPRKYK